MRGEEWMDGGGDVAHITRLSANQIGLESADLSSKGPFSGHHVLQSADRR